MSRKPHPRFIADIPNCEGYELILLDRTGAETRAKVEKDSQGCHFLTVNGARVNVNAFYTWHPVPIGTLSAI